MFFFGLGEELSIIQWRFLNASTESMGVILDME
jgi:hypothetical protein